MNRNSKSSSSRILVVAGSVSGVCAVQVKPTGQQLAGLAVAGVAAVGGLLAWRRRHQQQITRPKQPLPPSKHQAPEELEVVDLERYTFEDQNTKYSDELRDCKN